MSCMLYLSRCTGSDKLHLPIVSVKSDQKKEEPKKDAKKEDSKKEARLLAEAIWFGKQACKAIVAACTPCA